MLSVGSLLAARLRYWWLAGLLGALAAITRSYGVFLGITLALLFANPLWGRTDDKVITFFMFGLIAFFAILVIVLSLVQIRLDTRKERRKEDLERLGRV